jgi:hypothetical protein
MIISISIMIPVPSNPKWTNVLPIVVRRPELQTYIDASLHLRWQVLVFFFVESRSLRFVCVDQVCVDTEYS